MPTASRFDPKKLCVVTCISNPVRFASRYKLYQRFASEMAAAGANLLTVEAAFGDRPHETPVLAFPPGCNSRGRRPTASTCSCVPTPRFGTRRTC